MSIPVLQDAELDALTEVCSIGMGHAATALSQLMRKGVSIEVPRLLILDKAGLTASIGTQEVFALHLMILGNVRGTIVMLLPKENAYRILKLLLGNDAADDLPLSALEESTLKELGNLVASACLNALGNMLKMTLLPSVPTLIDGEAQTVLAQLMKDGSDDAVVMIDTVFSIAETLSGGSIFLMPAPASLGLILEALGAR